MYIGAAIHEYGHAMGLAHNTKNKKSVMFPNPTKALPTKVPNVDKKAMKKRYAKAPKKGVHPFSERMHATWIKEYPNLKSLQKASPIIVDGYVTSSQTVKGSIPKTKHTFQIEKIRRGANKLTSRKISIKQLGTKKSSAGREYALIEKTKGSIIFKTRSPKQKGIHTDQ
ncbi:matrixin family metalloprotease [Listeria grayi]|uniref:Zn-dependent protease n=1 Tax=Listeria grayi FSL F6-1183 TaxID=1265827 RepID=A0A829R6B5_LISGR|nr:matrixin family metalloprotease [Listeria grayi]EUJ28567.1 Zn-dependent protease [Listeria grayi FSL F6-1183]